MMQGGNQQSPSSPRKESSIGGRANSTKYSLGHQLKQFTAPMSQQHHHNQPVHSSSLGFSLGVNSQRQSHSHQKRQQSHGRSQQQHTQSVPNNGGGNHLNGGGRGGDGVGSGGMFEHLLQGANAGPKFNQQQFVDQMANQNLPDSMSNPSMVEQNVQGVLNLLSTLQQKVQQLQALVPLISQTAHFQTDSNVIIAQQQAASAAVVSIMSQLAMAATGLLPQQQSSQITPVNQAPDLSLSQLLQAAITPGLNLAQQNHGMGTSLGTSQRNTGSGSSMGKQFDTSGGAGPGVVGGANGGGLSNGLVFSSGGGGGFSGLGNEGEHSGQQNFGEQQAAGGGSSSRNPMGGGGEKYTGNPVGGRSRGERGGGSGTSNVLGSSLGAGAGSNAFMSHESGGSILNPGLDDPESNPPVDDEDSDGEDLPPGSFDLVEMDATEILAEHTHFCEICGKGFKRDANLRMHMRGHGDEYKTAAALARPDRASQNTTATRSRRYSCPYVGCKRNKKHRKFQPLKTMLCVKNHYRRSHCPKVLTCQKCKAKKFSVVADLKTHEKHCGRDKWQCSCGTTFSRKDKLFGHISLFVGHTPAVAPLQEMEGPGVDHQGSSAEGAFGSGNHNGAGFLSGSENVDTFGSSGGSGMDAGNGLEMGLGSGHGGIMSLAMDSRGGNGNLSLSDEGGQGLSVFTF